MTQRKMQNKIVFDGNCSFCSGWSRFIQRWDRDQVFAVIASQSKEGQELLSLEEQALAEHTILVFTDDKRLLRSDAVLYILQRLPWFWIPGYLALIVPRLLRDDVYDWVARYRHHLPSPK